MMDFRLLRAVDEPPKSWKNGRGLTREVATFPQEASLSDFKWRASIASVSEAGAFSVFPGVMRMLNVLDGELYLVLRDRSERLFVGAPPTVFSGNEAVSGYPARMPVSVFNLMLREGWTADVRWCSSVGDCLTTDVLIVAREPTRMAIGTCCIDLAAHDVAHFRQATHTTFHVDRPVLRADIYEPGT